MNKGLEIRNNKLRKNTIKRNTILDEQLDICRFISIKYQVISKVNGKYRRTGSDMLKGLQIKNRMYQKNGKYKLLNSKGVKILEIYEGIPSWADDYLIEKYNDFYKTK